MNTALVLLAVLDLEDATETDNQQRKMHDGVKSSSS